MNKKIFALALAVIMLFATGCHPDESKSPNDNSSIPGDNNSKTDGNNNVEEKNENGEFIYKGVIKSLDNSRYIEIEIIDSNVAYGVYWVLVGEQTEFLSKNGNEITRGDLKVGNTIEVTFSGQVMMSFPPQIAARVITLL